MGLLYGGDALKALQNYRDQQDFNSQVIRNIQNAFNAIDTANSSLSQNGADILKNGQTIGAVQGAITTLQESFTSLGNNYTALSGDNAAFKSNITSQIASFNSALETFSGNLTALQAASQQNTNDVTNLKQKTDSALLQSVMSGLTTLGDQVKTIISESYQPALDKAVSDINNRVSSLQSSNDTALANAVAPVNDKISANASAIAALSGTVSTNQQNNTNAITGNATAIQGENTRATQRENALDGEIAAVSSGLAAEVSRAKQAESTLQNGIDEAKNKADDSLEKAKNYTDNALTNGENFGMQYIDGHISTLKTEIETEYQAGDQATLTAAKQYTDTLNKQTLENSASAVDAANTAENIAGTANAKATDAVGQVTALAPQVTAANNEASAAMTRAKQAPVCSIGKAGTVAYSDSLISVTMSGSTAAITGQSGVNIAVAYNGGTYQPGNYNLSSGYAAQVDAWGASGYGRYFVDNRNGGVTSYAVFTLPSN